MATETELKVRVADLAALRRQLEDLGGTVVSQRSFEDNVLFDHPDGRLRAAGAAVRVRQASGQSWLTFKGRKVVDQGIKSREELEVVVSSAEVLQAILLSLGLVPTFRYQKYRETLQLNAALVMLDETPIGSFAEIEGTLPAVRAVAALLGFTADDAVVESYASLFLQALIARGDDRHEMVFDA